MLMKKISGLFHKYFGLPADAPTPIPPRQYSWYINFWHIVYLGLLTVLMAQIVAGAFRAGFGWREAVLLGAMLTQAGLYLKLVAFSRVWPMSRRDLALYFGGSLGLWWLEWQLEPGFLWLVMSYMGQLYGIAPPALAVPGSALIFIFVFGQSLDWQIADVSPWELFGIAMGWASFTVMFLFIHFLTTANQQRAKLIQDLRAAQQELEAARQRDAELAALRERERLARDLHDSLGHALVVTAVQLEAIQRLYKVDPERGSEHVDELKVLTRRSMADLRRSLEGLRAPGLGDRALTEALQTVGVEIGQRAHLHVQCRVPPEADALSPAIAETLWRVTQECLANVEKHARARQVELRLEVQPEAVVLNISDDGVGLPQAPEQQRGHYGLRGMRERVEGLGGTLTVNGHGRGTGTRVEARLPLIKTLSPSP